MKKTLILSSLLLLSLTACGAAKTETLSCTYETNTANLTTNMRYNIDYQDNEVKKVRITYNYDQVKMNDTDNDGKNDMDGVGTGTDGTTNDTQQDNDGIIDGVVGSAIDNIVGNVTDVILDVAGLKDRHANVQNTYGNIQGFSTENMTDTDNSYKVTYVIDYDKISDDDLRTLNLSRDVNTLKQNYISQGFTCK